jgi:hypothetical protein
MAFIIHKLDQEYGPAMAKTTPLNLHDTVATSSGIHRCR